jgi:hypothetical protein
MRHMWKEEATMRVIPKKQSLVQIGSFKVLVVNGYHLPCAL